MKIIIKSTNLKLTSSITKYLEEKIKSLEKFAKVLINKKNSKNFLGKKKSAAEAWVEVGKTTFHHQKGEIFRTELQLKIAGRELRAEAISKNIFSAINEVKDEMERQIKKYKGKIKIKYQRGARKLKKDLRISPRARFYRKGRIREEGI